MISSGSPFPLLGISANLIPAGSLVGFPGGTWFLRSPQSPFSISQPIRASNFTDQQIFRTCGIALSTHLVQICFLFVLLFFLYSSFSPSSSTFSSFSISSYLSSIHVIIFSLIYVLKFIQPLKSNSCHLSYRTTPIKGYQEHSYTLYHIISTRIRTQLCLL